MGCVEPPTTTEDPPGCREKTVPETVMGAPPAESGCVPIRNVGAAEVVAAAGGEVAGLTTSPPALEVEVPGSTEAGVVDGDGPAGSTTDGEVDGDGLAGSMTDGEVDGDELAGGSLLVGSFAGVVGINVVVGVGVAIGEVDDPGEAGSDVEVTAAGLVMDSAVGVVDVDVNPCNSP